MCKKLIYLISIVLVFCLTVGVTHADLRHRWRLDGDLDAEADPPELEFEISLANGKCAIQGRAVGER